MLHEQECSYFSANGVMFLDFWRALASHMCFMDGMEQRADVLQEDTKKEHVPLLHQKSGHILHLSKGKDLIHYHVLPNVCF